MKKIIATTNAPAAIGPYSQAIDCGSFRSEEHTSELQSR